MLASSFWKRLRQTGDSKDLEELRRSTIQEIAGVVFGLAWLLLIAAYGEPSRLAVPFLLLASSLGSIWLNRTDFRVVLTWLLGTLLISIGGQKGLDPSSPAQFGFPLVVVVSSLLVSGLGIFGVAAASSFTLLAVAGLQGSAWLDRDQVLVPLLLIWMTAAAAWIGSRQMNLALDWMRHTYTQATELLGQLRDERASLARTLKMLEDAYVRIEKMNYALLEARTAAETARHLKAEFAANISHELRTPLNLIIGFSETMANAPETYPSMNWSPELRGDIEQIYQSSRHLASLIDDILDLSALDARRLGLALQPTDLRTVIAEARTMMQDLYNAKGLYLDLEADEGLPEVRIDATRIRQVLINLLTNASRFTTRGGVTIRATSGPAEVVVAVQDTGTGIAARDIPKVFEEFGQVDGSTTRKHEGTGLGVPLSRRLVESHGGRMWLESTPGAGTTFYFTLPVSPPATDVVQSVPSPKAGAPSTRKSLLAYDPDPWIRRTLLRQMGAYDVVSADATDDLSALIDQHQPIAMITSAHQPDLAAVSIPDDLPVIRISLASSLRAAEMLGARDYLVKPVLRAQLLQVIAGLEREIHEVLIVDDDPELVELLARMLQSAGKGYHAVKAFGGEDALARLASQKPDLVVLDLYMPEKDGLAVLAALKADAQLESIPVIIVSAQPPEDSIGETGVFVELTRRANGSTSETLGYVQALAACLPPRGLPAPASD